MAIQAGIRLDYLDRIIDAIKSDRELESIIGSPVEKHIVLLIEDGRFKFHQLTPFGENQRAFTPAQMARAAAAVERLIKANYPGTDGLPEVR